MSKSFKKSSSGWLKFICSGPWFWLGILPTLIVITYLFFTWDSVEKKWSDKATARYSAYGKAIRTKVFLIPKQPPIVEIWTDKGYHYEYREHVFSGDPSITFIEEPRPSVAAIPAQTKP